MLLKPVQTQWPSGVLATMPPQDRTPPAVDPSGQASAGQSPEQIARTISALEDAEDYTVFEGAVTADYDPQSAVERELVLRLASILWRLRRAITMETELFGIQADHLREFSNKRSSQPNNIGYATFPTRAADDASQHYCDGGPIMKLRWTLPRRFLLLVIWHNVLCG